MKNVWIVNHYAELPSNFGGTRHYSLAKNLKNFGWESHIIAASTSLNTQKKILSEGESVAYQFIDGVSFLRLKASAYKSNGLRRLWNMLTFSVRLLFRSSTKMLPLPDVIIGSTVHPFAALAGYALSRRYGVPFIYEVRDLWPQTLVDMGALKEKSFATRFFRKIEEFLSKKSKFIISLLPKSNDYFKRYGVPNEKIVWIPNGVEIKNFPYLEPASDKSVFDLYYFGAHGRANNLMNLILAMEILNKSGKSKEIKLNLVGDGPEKMFLMEKVAALRLKNIEFFNPVPKNEIGRLCLNADAFIFNLSNIDVFRYGISSNKLFDYMACGRPIVFCCEASNNIVKEADCGITVTPDNPSHLADGILSMVNLSLENRIQMGKNGRKYVAEKNDFSFLAERLSGILEDCVRVQ